MTDLRHDLPDLAADSGATPARIPAGINPYGSSVEKAREPVRSADPYAALRQDADEREAQDFGLSRVSSLPGMLPVNDEPTKVVPPEPVLSEAVLIAAGLLDPETSEPTKADTTSNAGPTFNAGPTVKAEPTPSSAAPATGHEVTFADFLTDDREAPEEADLTEIFAGLETVEAPAALWRRGDDDLIGAGNGTSRSAKRISLRLRRRAA